MKTSKILLLIFTLFAPISFTVSDSCASAIEFEMNTEYSEGTEPLDIRPWATATFIDNGINNVTLTMYAGHLTGSEFISVWLFNFDPGLDPDLLAFSLVGTPGSLPNSINTGTNTFKAGPERFYDIEFDFPPPRGGYEGKFTAGETVVYNITYTGLETINAYSFDFESTAGGNHGHYHSAAHIQGIGHGDGSGWVANTTTVVPEPVSSILFIAGGAVLGYMRFLRKRIRS